MAHHVTLRADVPPDFPLPPEEEGVVVGLANDGAGVQALVVEIDGTTTGPDGATYHVTWSLRTGRRPAEANDVLRERGWIAVDPQPVSLIPRFFPFRR